MESNKTNVVNNITKLQILSLIQRGTVISTLQIKRWINQEATIDEGELTRVLTNLRDNGIITNDADMWRMSPNVSKVTGDSRQRVIHYHSKTGTAKCEDPLQLVTLRLSGGTGHGRIVSVDSFTETVRIHVSLGISTVNHLGVLKEKTEPREVSIEIYDVDTSGGIATFRK